jgi:hypothetical protein
MKYEWRKKEKELYLPKNKPEQISVPELNYLTISGEGNPNSSHFSEYIGALYSVSYAIKMTLKKENTLKDYTDYTVYPLEGIWDITEKAKKNFTGKINKDDLVFKLMIRQPRFVTPEFVNEMIEFTKVKKPHRLLHLLTFETTKPISCVQMLHVGSYDNEPESFKQMETFSEENNLTRLSKSHQEIYLSDFRKVPIEKLKTVLRFEVD